MHLVVIGLGYVGLPLVYAASKAGIKVSGYDTNTHVVGQLNSGLSHVDDISNSQISEIVKMGFQATSSSEVFGNADVIVICVPTPLSESGGPDLSFVENATEIISKNMTSNTLVVLESTTYPGTTEQVLLPKLRESGLTLDSDFWLAFSPERIDPGNKFFTITNTPKVVGGVTENSTTKAVDFYERFIESVVVAKGAKEAEMAKLLENTYRHVNIALVNELAQLCELLNIDLWDSIKSASTKPFGYQAFWPGPGVGGHCIPIDPNYLSHHVKFELGRPFRFVELAQEINESMPGYIFSRVQQNLNNLGKPVKGSKILLLGVTYKSNIADQRESPVRPLAEKLIANGGQIKYYDPHVKSWNVGAKGEFESISNESLVQECSSSDIVIILQAHEKIDFDIVLAESRNILDTRGMFVGENVERL